MAEGLPRARVEVAARPRHHHERDREQRPRQRARLDRVQPRRAARTGGSSTRIVQRDERVAGCAPPAPSESRGARRRPSAASRRSSRRRRAPLTIALSAGSAYSRACACSRASSSAKADAGGGSWRGVAGLVDGGDQLRRIGRGRIVVHGGLVHHQVDRGLPDAGRGRSARCTLAWQAAHVMPSTGSVTFRGSGSLLVGCSWPSPTSRRSSRAACPCRT